MATSIFAPYKKKLNDYKKRLQIVVDGIEAFDVTAYNSIPEITKGIKDLRNDIKANLAHVENNMNTTEATMAASVAAKAPSGVDKSLKGIRAFIQEIIAAAECLKLIGEIVILMAKILILLAKKAMELGETLVKLAMAKVQAFLDELKANIIKKINAAKAKAIADAKKKFYAKKVKDTQDGIKINEANISKRIETLKGQGKSETDINNDDTIKAWKQQIKEDKAKLDEMKEQGLM